MSCNARICLLYFVDCANINKSFITLPVKADTLMALRKDKELNSLHKNT
jgi:hypothetical protein